MFKPRLVYLAKPLQFLNYTFLLLKTSNIENTNSSCLDANKWLWCAVLCNLVPFDLEGFEGVIFNHLTTLKSYFGIYFKTTIVTFSLYNFAVGTNRSVLDNNKKKCNKE